MYGLAACLVRTMLKANHVECEDWGLPVRLGFALHESAKDANMESTLALFRTWLPQLRGIEDAKLAPFATQWLRFLALKA